MASFWPVEAQAGPQGDDGVIRLWDAQTMKQIAHRKGHEKVVAGLAFTSDGKQIVSCTVTDL